MSEAVKEFKKDNEVLKIFYDFDAQNPREDRDNFGTMVCWHRRYILGDKHNLNNPDDFWLSLAGDIIGDAGKAEQMSRGKLEEAVSKKVIVLPLYLYDHSGLALRTVPFSCPWDSGQVGWVYVTKEKVREEYDVKKVTRKIREKVERVIKSEIEEFEYYLNGEVYGFEIEDEKGSTVDSCWGFFGYDFARNGLIDQAGEKWREVIQ